MSPADHRTRTLDAAERLFFGNGIAVTGVDAVAREAGVSVVTLYKHFGTKDRLVAAVLQRRLEDWDRVWQEQVAAVADPRAKVLAVLDAVPAFREQAGPTQWCTFLAAASERPRDAGDPVAALLAEDSRLLGDRLRRLAEAADPDRVDEVVATTTLVYNGVLASLLRGVPLDPAPRARRAAALALGWDDLVREV